MPRAWNAFALAATLLVLAPATPSSGQIVRTSVTCTSLIKPEECDLCVRIAQRPLTACEKKARRRFRRVIRFREAKYPDFSWSYDGSALGGDNVSLTLYAWDATADAKEPGYPIPGCCGVPLTEGGCRASVCLKGDVFYRVASTKRCSYYAIPPVLSRFESCQGSDDREMARYLYLCPDKQTHWMQALNCECVKYDTMTGDFMPTNDSQPYESLSYNVWLNLHRGEMSHRFTHVCMFSLSKNQVMSEGTMTDGNKTKESLLFQRGVYDMPQRTWANGSVLGLKDGSQIKCNAWRYNGSSVFELTSSTPDNDTFTCLVMWPNGTNSLRTFASHVKCMPRNATYVPFNHDSVYSNENAKNDMMARTLAAIVGGCGALVLLAVICFFAWKCHRNVKAYLKKNHAIPPHMESILDKTYPATSHTSLDEREKIDLLVYDAAKIKDFSQEASRSKTKSQQQQEDDEGGAAHATSRDHDLVEDGYNLKLARDAVSCECHCDCDVTEKRGLTCSFDSNESGVTSTSLTTEDSGKALATRTRSSSGSMSPDSGFVKSAGDDCFDFKTPGRSSRAKAFQASFGSKHSFSAGKTPPHSGVQASSATRSERAFRSPLLPAQIHCTGDVDLGAPDFLDELEEEEEEVAGYLSKVTLTPVDDVGSA